MDFRAVLRERKKELLAKKNVVAVGVGYKVKNGETTSILSIVCSVKRKVNTAELSKKDIIPKQIDGVLTDVIETGPIKALVSHTDRMRPAMGGISVGHPDITAGTLGVFMTIDDIDVIISNNHVLANCNEAEIGDSILQPGPYDGGKLSEDEIGVLADFLPVKFEGEESNCLTSQWLVGFLNFFMTLFKRNTRFKAVQSDQDNYIDMAIGFAYPGLVSKEILEIGIPKGISATQPTVGMKVKKSGRTSGLTYSHVIQTDVTVKVGYGDSRMATFADQVMTGSLGEPGDSGSIILNEKTNEIVGLLFAGSDEVTLFSPAKYFSLLI